MILGHITPHVAIDSKDRCKRRKTAKPKTIRHDAESLRGIPADMDRLDRVAERLGV